MKNLTKRIKDHNDIGSSIWRSFWPIYSMIWKHTAHIVAEPSWWATGQKVKEKILTKG